jgi:electron transport complex protein RnfD
MGMVSLALLPATGWGIWTFGWPALWLLLTTIAATVLAESVCLGLARKAVRAGLGDGSAVLTAWLLALSLPPWAPWWIGAFGGLFAAVLGKHVFGGLGQNPFNPAMLARVALLVAFPVEMTVWPSPQMWLPGGTLGFSESLSLVFVGSPSPDATSGATYLGHARDALSHGIGSGTAALDLAPAADLLLPHAGSLGEISAPLLVAGGLFLLARRVISWHIPVAMLGSLALLAAASHALEPERYPDAGFHLFSGAAIIGAFFIATDPVTSPSTPHGRLLFGAGCGLLTFIIRTYGGFPEGVAFAVLLMNAATPVIDHYLRPRVYGRTRRGRPMPAQRAERP